MNSIKKLQKCNSIADVKALFEKCMPLPIRDFVIGGADDEICIKDNESVFDRYYFAPKFCQNIQSTDTSVEVMGVKSASPVICSPFGGHKLVHSAGELATGKAFSNAKIPFSLSTYASVDMETIAGKVSGHKFFQLQATTNRKMMQALIERAKTLAFDGLIVTVDNPIHGNRERDKRAGFGFPTKLSIRSVTSMLAHPKWLYGFVTQGFKFENFRAEFEQGKSLKEIIENFSCSVSWEDIKFIREQWPGKLAIKGILHPDDASQAVAIGADAIYISNQGARQYDFTTPSFYALEEVVSAVGGKIEIIMDGGIRRGSDVVKALALGATACSTARPFAYGLGAAGQQGVEFVINQFQEEITRAMMICGAKTVSDLSKDILRKRY
ncbi:alpha-hydroxy acid oxidase [Thalassotalea psychrophila]|uniref:Alpha-hydroxy acid oxidase n=1 Tax=Thalassotalea psychrophila TaxID=3065647 RepID=A0ABY9TXM5_9GAMM|nr:alpha-hydroxy acid oxidase [Colwelliaceae bacterium SQ149]